MTAVAQGLIHQPQGSNGDGSLTIYDRVDPFKFIEDMGRVFGLTGAGGADTLEKGKLLALACLSRRMDIFQLSGTYHLISGKLSMKSDVMLAKYRKAGGRHRWINDGSDGIQAIAEFTFEGQSHTVSYSMDDAKRADLLAGPGKRPGNWEKNPAAMLRARVISSGVRMLAPEVLEGSYCPEELTDEPETAVQGTVVQSSAPSAASIVGVDQSEAGTVKRKRRTAAEIAADQAAAASGSTQGNATATAATATESSAATATESDVIDVEATTATTATATQGATTSTAPAQEFNPELAGSIKPETIAKIDALAGRFGTNREGLEAHLKAGNEGFAGILSLSETAGSQLAANLETQLNAAAAAAASAQAGK